jgi:hypothetical protein
MVLTWRLCVAYGSQHKHELPVYTASTDLFCITELGSVYCAVRTESLYKTKAFRLHSIKWALVTKCTTFIPHFVNIGLLIQNVELRIH